MFPDREAEGARTGKESAGFRTRRAVRWGRAFLQLQVTADCFHHRVSGAFPVITNILKDKHQLATESGINNYQGLKISNIYKSMWGKQ